MNPDVSNNALTRFRTQILNQSADILAQALSSQNGSVWTGALAADQPAPGTPPSGICAALQCTGALTGELFFLLATAESKGLLSALKAENGEDPAPIWLNWLEELRTSLESVFEGLPGVVTLGGGQVVALPHEAQPLGSIALTGADGASGRVLLSLDARLATALTQLMHGAEAADPGRDLARLRKPKIERVIDVPLAVTLRFGQRHLTLREVLALSTGSLVELDKQVEEPVDLVLGDRLIARGEVVIVDGNYGLRVTEVVEGRGGRLDRLASQRADDGLETGTR